jgi:SAM-dependent methyltransferase
MSNASVTELAVQTRKFSLQPRACECCGGSDVEALWYHEFDAHTRNAVWHFQVNNVICRDCGFAFVSPIPTATELQEYYGDSHSYLPDQTVDFDVEKRLNFISQVLKECPNVNAGSFLEIGANNRTAFHTEMEKRFATVRTVEVNNEVDANFVDVRSVADNSVDVVASYFVLEHIPNVREFLAGCARVLKDGGIMIAEIPDVSIYPRDFAALIFHEHVNHFSVQKFSEIAAELGFEPLTTSYDQCSRPFGFVGAFVKRSQSASSLSRINEYSQNKEQFLRGAENVRVFFERMEVLYKQVVGQRGEAPVLLWGANNNLKYFLRNKQLPANIFVVDSNPLKKDFLGYLPVHTPGQLAEQIEHAERLLIFAGEVHKQAILKSISEQFGKTFRPESVHCVTYESLSTLSV